MKENLINQLETGSYCFTQWEMLAFFALSGLCVTLVVAIMSGVFYWALDKLSN